MIQPCQQKFGEYTPKRPKARRPGPKRPWPFSSYFFHSGLFRYHIFSLWPFSSSYFSFLAFFVFAESPSSRSLTRTTTRERLMPLSSTSPFYIQRFCVLSNLILLNAVICHCCPPYCCCPSSLRAYDS